MSAFTNPSFPEIIRATQKDDLVMTQMTNEISSNVLLKILGPRSWIPWKQWIEASVHFAYFAITTLADLQTIGEEYTGILQVTSATDGRKFKIPSKWARLIMIGTESFGPLILKHWSKIAGVKNPNILKFLDLFEYASQFHIIWFYLEETFFQISKRIVDVQYIKLRFESFAFSMADFLQNINSVSSFSVCLNGIFS